MNLELNKIHNIDCLEFMKTLPDKCIDLVLTDPPYGVNYEGGATNKNKREKLENDNNAEIYQKIYPELYRIMKDDASAYIFYGSGYEKDIFPIPLFSKYEILIWFKTNASFGAANARYKQDYEPFIYLRKNEGSKWYGDSKQRKVWFEKRNAVNDLHPTQKPEDIISRMIQNSSKEGDIVFDPFMGSGTTAIACKHLKRNYIGCEISADYCKIIEDRLSGMTQGLF